MGTRARRLLFSIHDVGPRSESAVDQLMARTVPVLGGERLAMLVVPDHWGEAPLIAGSPFATRLRGWAERGVEIFAHGWFHKDIADHAGGLASFKAKHMTAGEGEFLGLDQPVALDRMVRGKALIEDIIGRPVAGFIAPAWLYGPGALAALPQAGFMLAEDHMKVWRVADNRVLARGPVITWASRSENRARSSIAFAALARLALGGQRIVRVAVHPGDVTRADLLASIDATLGRFAKSHAPARYADLLG